MAVPSHYSTTDAYFVDVVDFLKTYSWIYSAPNTHILVTKVFDRFPSEWLPFLKSLSNQELNELALGHVPSQAPASLRTFFKRIENLKFNFKKHIFKETIPNNSVRKLSKKKEHEILSLAPLIHEICEKSNCDFIVDVGTGLGYLPRLLHNLYSYPSLAIEGSPEKIKLAHATQRKYPESSSFIKYMEHFITAESAQHIQEAVNEIPLTNACITGLHACADLSVTVLELFTKLSFCKSLVIMPCCYHRLKQNNDEFEHFPASGLLKEMSRTYNAGDFLKTPFLRLACQASADGFSCMTMEQHQERTHGCLFRAILEDVCVAENYQVKRLKRKSGKFKLATLHDEPFEIYLTNLQHTHTLIGCEITDHQFLAKMREKWTQHKGNAYLIEVLAAFQAAMQNLCENVVLLDRVMFLKEKGIECFVVKVTDQRISPRCHVIVATKP